MSLFQVEKISYSSSNKSYSVNLSEIGGERVISIFINKNKAQSIALALDGIKTPRPMTHDIILEILNYSNIKIDKIEVYKTSKGILYSRFWIKSKFLKEKHINCRVSDAIEISLRYCFPIYIENKVLNDMKPKYIGADMSFYSIEEYRNKNFDSDALSKLVYALTEAIDKENYEVAAKLRDKINSIENLDK